ncbi:MAG: tRNA (adenosine(37)-N6)-threonylcarbamoyltransferase complex ATPase subunit type 1 TsaE [Omnitrophica bacterium GWA2_41_15]|nr:MAG: tRNA (adenosine(37)-N6)-threonylcarbamoyltransferase complex ATPase subunit type 1 TsaE [Omnitrophica bacterium GWA2_41_15]HAZ10257.1 tRNA (adenosine(37)-N6)-threonylcarbamoyltransferase complex ATPase subunit type 1 TsaE [Candidatus Omnitrophota bacterium]
MITNSAKETMLIGERLARKLKPGDMIALSGDLGSGKTTFTKGIGKGLGVKDSKRINSPTFVLIKEYNGRVPLYHLDLYRLDDLKEIENLAIEEYIYGNGITVIEWAEKIKSILPKKHILVKFKIKGDNKREVIIEDLRY